MRLLSRYLLHATPPLISERIAHERLVRVCFSDYDRDIPLVAAWVVLLSELAPCFAGQLMSPANVLADALGVSRTAVWKQLNALADYGLQIESVKGRGYRIPGGIDLLDADLVRSATEA